MTHFMVDDPLLELSVKRPGHQGDGDKNNQNLSQNQDLNLNQNNAGNPVPDGTIGLDTRLVAPREIDLNGKPETPQPERLPEDKGAQQNANLNATAYRIFKLLLWLNDGPLSVEDLNERFYNDPDIRKRLSNDSVWLYINTLKALGCQIKRPCRSNGFKYELQHHPFGIFLAQDLVEMLIAVKATAEEQLTHLDILTFDRFLKKIVQRSALTDRQRQIEEIFSKSRTWDYKGFESIVDRLQEAIEQRRVLQLTYQSPMRGRAKLYFLPDRIIYRNGLLYLSGNQHGREEAGMLRVERIEQLETLEIAEYPEIYATLAKLQQQEVDVHMRLFLPSAQDFHGFGLGEAARFVSSAPATPSHVAVTLKTREFFFLKQKILALGVPFEIVAPEAFRLEVLGTLKTMGRLYEEEAGNAE